MHPTKCLACYKYHHHTIDKTCPLCHRIAFSEHILCDLVREGHDGVCPFECFAFRPNLLLVAREKQLSTAITPKFESDETRQSSQETQRWKDKWFLAYAKQQLDFYTDHVFYEVKFHLCLTTRHRRQLLDDTDQYFASLAELVYQSGKSFGGNVALLAMGADHLHIYMNFTSNDAFEEIARHILTATEQGCFERFPEWCSSPGELIFNHRYFVETIGR